MLTPRAPTRSPSSHHLSRLLRVVARPPRRLAIHPSLPGCAGHAASSPRCPSRLSRLAVGRRPCPPRLQQARQVRGVVNPLFGLFCLARNARRTPQFKERQRAAPSRRHSAASPHPAPGAPPALLLCLRPEDEAGGGSLRIAEDFGGDAENGQQWEPAELDFTCPES